jgi:hypothetical protein
MKWLKNNEVNKSGFYLLTRTDDYDTNTGTAVRVLEFIGDFYLYEGDPIEFCRPISEFDEECRWLGPIERPE